MTTWKVDQLHKIIVCQIPVFNTAVLISISNYFRCNLTYWLNIIFKSSDIKQEHLARNLYLITTQHRNDYFPTNPFIFCGHRYLSLVGGATFAACTISDVSASCALIWSPVRFFLSSTTSFLLRLFLLSFPTVTSIGSKANAS